LHRAIRSFLMFWELPILNRKRSKLFLLSAVLGLCLIRAYIGLIGARLFAHDAFMFFDGAWRMLNGQRPHIDFYSHLGFLTYIPTIAGLWISHGTAWGFGYGQALAGLVTGAWTYLLGRERLADVPLALLCIAVTLITVAPFALGFPPQMGPSTTYNRLGYALIALAIVEAVARPGAKLSRQAPVSTTAVSEFCGGLSTGVLIAILFFLKITYFTAAIFLLAALIPCRLQTKYRWLGMAAGFISATLPCCAYLSFNMKPLLRDLITIGGGKHIQLGAYISDEILQQTALVLVFVICTGLLILKNDDPNRALSVIVAGVVVSLAGVGLILGNSEESGFPLAAFLAIVLLNEVILSTSGRSIVSDDLRLPVFLLGAVFIGASLLSGLMGTTAGVVGRIHIAHRLPPLSSPVLSGFIPAGVDYWYGNFVNDGLSLVTRFRRPGDTIMSLDFTNPFSYSLAMKPAQGGATVLQYNTTFNDRFRPSADFLFGSAQLVALPKRFSDGSLDVNIDKLYGPYLRNHFHEIGESREWLLYRRNN
jgi:hypothetical protein